MPPSPEGVLLVHQVHPVKIAFDAGASIVSNILLWQHRLWPAILARYVPPVVGSALVTTFGDMVTAIGSWRRRPTWLVAGVLIVVAGWSHGLTSPPLRGGAH